MKELYHRIMEDIKAHPPDYGEGDAQSILEILYTCYHQFNRMDTDEIKRDFDKLYTEMADIPLRDMDPIIDTVCCLCSDHEKAGFVAGVKAGFELATELK